ncbi:ABC transporter permease, partial [Bradyrhizobium elkanii]
MSDLELSVAAKNADRPKLAPGRWLWSAVLPVALVALLLGFAAVDGGVLSPANLLNIAQQTSYLALFAMAQTVVILTRGFDLALGPTVSMVSVGTALAMAGATASGHGTGAVLLAGLAAGFLLGTACGLFNGVVIALLGVNPFVATLGSYNIAIGVATTLSSGRPVQGVPAPFSQIFYGGSVFGIPAAIAITVGVGAVLHWTLTRTVFGRSLYLIGTNPRAAAVA